MFRSCASSKEHTVALRFASGIVVGLRWSSMGLHRFFLPSWLLMTIHGFMTFFSGSALIGGGRTCGGFYCSDRSLSVSIYHHFCNGTSSSFDFCD